MPLNVDNFAARIATMGLASPNKFEVDISFPNIVGIGEILNLMCETASIAGRTVQSMLDIQYGIRREIAYGAPQYTPLSLTFLCSESMQEKKLLDQWNNFIVDAVRPQGAFNVAYYDDYAKNCSLKVTSLAQDGVTENFSITYKEVYPKSVQSIQLNHSTQNTVLRVNAEMQYAFFETDDIRPSTSQPIFT